jgi:galactokinase
MKSFADVFGTSPDVIAAAPGRVNLLGEHTDYNDGFVLPTAIPQQTRIAAGKSNAKFTVFAADLDDRAEFTMDAPPEKQFATYVYGCVRELARTGVNVPILNLHVTSDVPIGAGLSSSAALEVGTLRALRQLLRLTIDDVTIAKLAQQAEIKYAGVNCGIMDQMASSLADIGHMLFLDTRSLDRKLLWLPARSEILVVDSGLPRTLVGSRYNERRRECEQAARILGVTALRDVDDEKSLDRLPELLRRRARHVVTENARVLQAIAATSADEFGALMNASHVSLRDDYEVSIPELDRLVAILQRQSDMYGARLTGAGFGGACVALCRNGSACDVGVEAVSEYNRGGGRGRVLVPPRSD